MISAFLAVLLAAACIPAVFAAEGHENFMKRYEYDESVFSDITPGDWFFENAGSVYEYGLMNGKGRKGSILKAT